MQDLKDKPSISLHTAYQVWYVCFQGKARLLEHTDSQLETFWTLQVRVVILDDQLNQATWFTMDGLNRKRCIRYPVLIESTININLIKPCYPHPSRYWTQIWKILSALMHLFLSILIWFRKVSSLSKMIPKNFVSGAIFVGELYDFNSGSGWSPLLIQKCIPRVLS